MKEIKFTDEEVSLLEKAVRCMVINLQYERHQAQIHGCSTGSYEKEIKEYRALKTLFED